MSGAATFARGNAHVARDAEQSLEVYEILRRAFDRCEPHAAPYLNVVGLFFHDLMRMLTGYVVRRNEVEAGLAPAEHLRVALAALPYFDYSDVTRGIRPDAKNYGMAPGRYGLRWKAAEYKWTLRSAAATAGGRRPPRVWTKGVGVDSRRLHDNLTRAGIRADYRTPTRVAMPGRAVQLRELRDAVREIWAVLRLPGSPELASRVVDRHILERTRETDPPVRFPYDAVLVGTLLGLEYRFMAALGRAHGVPVVAVCHGDQEGACSEPIYGYGERSPLTHYIGYGEAGGTVAENAYSRRSLYPPIQYVAANSDFIKRRFQSDDVQPVGALEGKRLMYVPSQFYGAERFGPFHDLADEMYVAWQESLFREFPHMILKRHPKEKFRPGLFPRSATRIMYELLERCMDEADVFAFDIASGAMFTAMATGKPVIYFDVGMRRFTREGEAAIRNRCIWVDADPSDPRQIREQLLANARAEKTQDVLYRFCLGPRGDDRPRHVAIVETLARVMRGEICGVTTT